MTDRKRYSYDSECQGLAEYFLKDRRSQPTFEDEAADLAQLFQDAAEGFLSAFDEESQS